MHTIKLKIKQIFCDHHWNRTHGWYDIPTIGAVCEKCDKVCK